MPIIFETDNFVVKGHDKPHHDRNNGGHAVVSPKNRYSDRTKMPIELYIFLMILVRITGEAITNVMTLKGLSIARINYQDNGNWSYFPSMKKEPHIHIHLYVRSYEEKHPTGDSRFKAFPDAIASPFVGDYPEFYESFKPYSDEDCKDIGVEIEKLLDTKYQEWKNKL
jgi:diadenosine tetraphosphate (Ap4A) HIT family hydrolase